MYSGSCRLQKNYIKNTKEDPTIMDMKLTTVMNLEKGDVVGLENVTDAANYSYTLTVKKHIYFDFTNFKNYFFRPPLNM